MPEPILEVPQPYTVLPGSASADTPTRVLTSQQLSPREIERICKAFIRLIIAAEELDNEKLSTSTNPPNH